MSVRRSAVCISEVEQAPEAVRRWRRHKPIERRIPAERAPILHSFIMNSNDLPTQGRIIAKEPSRKQVLLFS